MLACAALEQLCREGAWCRALVQRDVVPLLERLVRHEEDEVVHHAAGALQVLTRTLKGMNLGAELSWLGEI